MLANSDEIQEPSFDRQLRDLIRIKPDLKFRACEVPHEREVRAKEESGEAPG